MLTLSGGCRCRIAAPVSAACVSHRPIRGARMKRWIGPPLFAATFAACGICAPAWAGRHTCGQPQDAASRLCAYRNGGEPVRTLGAAPTTEASAPYFSDIPIRVVSAYGRTTLDMLSSGPFVLVTWPKGCCPDSGRWHMGDTRHKHTGDDRHVIFLWLAL